jgi:ubiquinone biosynthesis O-methyltransferase
MQNIDVNETAKFEAAAREWWNPDGPFRPLHVLNPVRLQYILDRVELKDKTIIDIGCGGGLLSESMARMQARVTGIDISGTTLNVARQHSAGSGLAIQYEISSPEDFASRTSQQFDVVACMEMLEHVPDPGSVIRACARLMKPGGQVFFSTINRTLLSYALAILAAERILRILPPGTHDYARFIRPSELAAWCRDCGMQVLDITGIQYIPFLGRATLQKDTAINYMMHARLAG